MTSTLPLGINCNPWFSSFLFNNKRLSR